VPIAVDRPSRPSRLRPLAGILAALAVAAPARAEWLVLRDASKLETRGPWRERGKLVVFTDAAGELRSLRSSEVDLDASRAETAAAAARLRAKTPPTPPPAPRPPVLVLTDEQVGHVSPSDEAAGAAARQATKAAPPPVTLYMTTWCGWCKRTRALLTRLEVPFVEKDIEASPEANAEHAAKAGPGAGVPVLDIGGKIVRGFDVERIQALVGRRLPSAGG
jgi:glutaredoxin